jgi:hypothetical protein
MITVTDFLENDTDYVGKHYGNTGEKHVNNGNF